MEKEILSTFLYNNKLKFNEIENLLKVRSNKLAYHLKKLLKEKTLEKEDEYYKLKDNEENIIPYISEKKPVLPVILVFIKDKSGNALLVKREKRPFKNLLGLPGGRITLKESIKDAAERIMKDKFKIKCKFKKINSISLEHVKKQDEIVHSFLLILVTAETKEKLEFTNLSKNKSKIISSDYNLIKNNINKKIEIEELTTFS